MGYAKSGKDSIAKVFAEKYGYTKIAFADNIKREMNQYLREAVCEDLNKREFEEVNQASRRGALITWKPWTVDQIDFFTEDLQAKKAIRPYIIWYGETLRNINGRFCWINRAFTEDGKDINKIILSDVRRLAELDIFKNSNEFKKRYVQSMGGAGLSVTENLSVNNFGTLLFEVNQYGLTDPDTLTVETIQSAREQWLIDDTFYVDPRIPDVGNSRQKSIKNQIKIIAKKFGIERPDKVTHKQITIFQAISDSENN